MMQQIEEVILRHLSLVQQMREKEEKLIEIYKKNRLEYLYDNECASLLVKLNKLNRDLDKLSDMFYIVGGIKK